MSTQIADRRLEEQRAGARTLSPRALPLAVLGPLTALGGVVWAVIQPYRITLLHPHHQGLYWLLVQPPLLVIVAGLAFHYLVARSLIADLERREGD
jgi:hypothetical protein